MASGPAAPAILFVSPYSPRAVGGVAQFLIDVGVQLIGEGFTVGFLYAEEPDEVALPAPLSSATCLEVSTRSPKGAGTILVVLRTARRIVSGLRGFALCHALVPQPLTTTAIVLARALGRPTVATIFAPYPENPNPIADGVQRIAERLALRMADEVVYECEATRRQFPRKGVVIYNGIDTAYYRPSEERRRELRSRLGIPADTVVFLYAGRITELKGIRDLIDAFQGLDPALLEKSLLLLVGPFKTPDPDAIIPPTMAHPERVRHIGPVGKYEILGYYQACDVFVLPSYWEGISSALVEAMACGLPALVSNAGGSPEVVVEGVSGFLHAPGDVRTLRERLQELIERADLRDSMGREARERIVTAFELRGMVRQYRDVYGRALG